LGAKAKSNWSAQRLFPLFICSKLSPSPRIKKGEQTARRKGELAGQVKSSVSINEISHHKLPEKREEKGARPGFIPPLTMHVHNKEQMSG